MENKIVVITSKFLHEFVTNAFERIHPDCMIETVTYPDFSHIHEIYKKYENEADGFLVSGRIARDAIIKTIPDHKKPIVSFETDSAGLYRQILELFVEKRNLDIDRVVLDFLFTTHNDASVGYFLNILNLPIIDEELDKWIDGAGQNDIKDIEKVIVRKIKKLWDDKKIDSAICLYSTIIPELESYGIPCKYPYPEDSKLKSLLEFVLSQSELNNMRENLPAVFIVSSSDPSINDQSEFRIALKNALLNIKANLALDMILQEEENGFHIYTSLGCIDYITNTQKVCHLSISLKEDYDLSVVVGYGIGRNITSAKTHAEQALKEALFAKGSFVVNENHSLIGPLNKDQYLEIRRNLSEDILKTAERCKLSTLTIQKLKTVLDAKGINKLTAQEIADRLGMTVRNANRILNNLEKGGSAHIAYTISSTSKGRPVKVYELNI